MRTTRWCAFALAALILTPAGPAWARHRRGRAKAEAQRDETVSPAPQRVVQPTYLDTLNAGRELRLSDDDFGAVARPPDTASASPSRPTAEMAEGFRIQCVASSDIEAVRARKKAVGTSLGYPTYIVYEKPYYKLHVGDFAARKDAESALARVKKAGYPEAWIVRSKVAARR
jgi:hypothetical protein